MENLENMTTLDFIKDDIDIGFEMAKVLFKYQDGGLTWEELKSTLIKLYLQGHNPEMVDFFESFVDNNKDNTLPNMSSGSFLNALLDFDGIMYNYEDQVDEPGLWDEAHIYYKQKYRELM